MTAADDHLDLRVVGSFVAAEGVRVLDLAAASGGALPGWTPGAHVEVYLPQERARHYSLCPYPDNDVWRVAVLLEESGRGGSQYLHEGISVGSSLASSQPRNHFPLVPAEEYLFIAGGIGITPLLSMIREVASGAASWRLFYGGRRRRTMAFADELESAHPDNVSVLPHDEYGILDLARLTKTLTAESVVYSCGPAPMLDALHSMTPDLARGRIHVERFGGAAPPASDSFAARSFELVLARTGVVVTVGPDEAVLDALERAGAHVTASCREGVCGSCETQVLAGTPLHRDSVLSEEEREQGDTMMVCVGRALSPSLTLNA